MTAEQAAEQAAEVSRTVVRLTACVATRRMPRLINRRLTARLRLARHLTFVVPLCRAATHLDKQALHRQPPKGQSRRTASCTKQPRLQCGHITLWMTVIVHRLDNSVVYRTLPHCPVIICMHDAAFSMHNQVELSAKNAFTVQAICNA